MAGPLDELVDQADEFSQFEPAARPVREPAVETRGTYTRPGASIQPDYTTIQAPMFYGGGRRGRGGYDPMRAALFQQRQSDRQLRLQEHEADRAQRQQDRAERQQSRAERQAATSNRLKASDLTARGIPYFRNATGDVSEVTDEQGAPLLHFDKTHGIAWDSQGQPKTVSYEGTEGPPVLKDPFEGIPVGKYTKAGVPTGDLYQRRPGLPDKWVGTDQAAKDAAMQAEKDKAIKTEAGLLGQKLSMDHADLVAGEREHTAMRKELQAAVPALLDPKFEGADRDTVLGAIDEHYNAEYGSPAANETNGWFSKELSPTAKKLRESIDQRKADARQKASRLFDLKDRVGELGDTVAEEQAARREQIETLIAHGRGEPGPLDEAPTPEGAAMPNRVNLGAPQSVLAGNNPGLVEQGNINFNDRPVVQNEDGTASTVRSMSFTEDGKTILVPTVAEDGSRILTDEEAINQYHQTRQHLGIFDSPQSADDYSQRLHHQQQGGMMVQNMDPQLLAAVKAGQRPYKIDENNQIQFDPAHIADSVKAAAADGLVDPAKAKESMAQLEELQKATEERQKLIDSAGNSPKLKAILSGAIKGSAFAAGFPLGAGAGAAAGAAIAAPTAEGAAPITVPIGALIGGLITGTIAAHTAEGIIKKVGQYNDTIHSLSAASELHPYYDTAGNLVSFGAGAFTKGASKAVGAAVERYGPGAVKTVTGLVGGARAEAAGKNVVDSIAKTYYASGGGLWNTIQNLSKDASVRAAQLAGQPNANAQIAKAITYRVGGAAALNVLIDTALNEGARALGLQDQGETWQSAVAAGLLGAFVSGHGLEVRGYNSKQMADLLSRAKVRFDNGIGLGEGLPNNIVADLGKRTKLDVSQIDSLKRPLSPHEQEVALEAAAKYRQLVNQGKAPGDITQIEATARQSLQGGEPIGVSAVEIRPGEAEAAPPAPEAPTPPALPGGPDVRSVTPEEQITPAPGEVAPPTPAAPAPATPVAPVPAVTTTVPAAPAPGEPAPVGPVVPPLGGTTQGVPAVPAGPAVEPAPTVEAPAAPAAPTPAVGQEAPAEPAVPPAVDQPTGQGVVLRGADGEGNLFAAFRDQNGEWWGVNEQGQPERFDDPEDIAKLNKHIEEGAGGPMTGEAFLTEQQPTPEQPFRSDSLAQIHENKLGTGISPEQAHKDTLAEVLAGFDTLQQAKDHLEALPADSKMYTPRGYEVDKPALAEAIAMAEKNPELSPLAPEKKAEPTPETVSEVSEAPTITPPPADLSKPSARRAYKETLIGHAADLGAAVPLKDKQVLQTILSPNTPGELAVKQAYNILERAAQNAITTGKEPISGQPEHPRVPPGTDVSTHGPEIREGGGEQAGGGGELVERPPTSEVGAAPEAKPEKEPAGRGGEFRSEKELAAAALMSRSQFEQHLIETSGQRYSPATVENIHRQVLVDALAAGHPVLAKEVERFAQTPKRIQIPQGYTREGNKWIKIAKPPAEAQPPVSGKEPPEKAGAGRPEVPPGAVREVAIGERPAEAEVHESNGRLAPESRVTDLPLREVTSDKAAAEYAQGSGLGVSYRNGVPVFGYHQPTLAQSLADLKEHGLTDQQARDWLDSNVAEEHEHARTILALASLTLSNDPIVTDPYIRQKLNELGDSLGSMTLKVMAAVYPRPGATKSDLAYEYLARLGLHRLGIAMPESYFDPDSVARLIPILEGKQPELVEEIHKLMRHANTMQALASAPTQPDIAMPVPAPPVVSKIPRNPYGVPPGEVAQAEEGMSYAGSGPEATGIYKLADGTEIPYTYQLVDLRLVVDNPDNERPGPASPQTKEYVAQNSGTNYKPERAFVKDPDFQSGPAFVEHREGRYVPAGGHRRTYVTRANYEAYKAELRKQSDHFGIDPIMVETMIDGGGQPYLVAVTDYGVPAEKRAALIRQLNEEVKQATNPVFDAVSAGRNLTENTIQEAQSLFESDTSKTPLALLQEAGAKPLSAGMLKDGAIRETDKLKYINANGSFTQEGAKFARLVLLGRIVDSPEVLGGIEDSPVENKLLNAIGQLHVVERRGGESQMQLFKDMLDLEHRRLSEGRTVAHFQELLDQEMFGHGRNERAEALQRWFNSFNATKAKTEFNKLLNDFLPVEKGQKTLLGDVNVDIGEGLLRRERGETMLARKPKGEMSPEEKALRELYSRLNSGEKLSPEEHQSMIKLEKKLGQRFLVNLNKFKSQKPEPTPWVQPEKTPVVPDPDLFGGKAKQQELLGGGGEEKGGQQLMFGRKPPERPKIEAFEAKGKSLDATFKEYAKADDSWYDSLDRWAMDLPKGVPMLFSDPQRPERVSLVTRENPSSRTPGWRVTWFDNKVPTGHTVENNRPRAIAVAMNGYPEFAPQLMFGRKPGKDEPALPGLEKKGELNWAKGADGDTWDGRTRGALYHIAKDPQTGTFHVTRIDNTGGELKREYVGNIHDFEMAKKMAESDLAQQRADAAGKPVRRESYIIKGPKKTAAGGEQVPLRFTDPRSRLQKGRPPQLTTLRAGLTQVSPINYVPDELKSILRPHQVHGANLALRAFNAPDPNVKPDKLRQEFAKIHPALGMSIQQIREATPAENVEKGVWDSGYAQDVARAKDLVRQLDQITGKPFEAPTEEAPAPVAEKAPALDWSEIVAEEEEEEAPESHEGITEQGHRYVVTYRPENKSWKVIEWTENLAGIPSGQAVGVRNTLDDAKALAQKHLDTKTLKASAAPKVQHGFVLADGPGAGKTVQELYVAKHVAEAQNHRVLVVTESQRIIDNAFAKDHELIPDMKLWRYMGDTPKPGSVYMATYTDIGRGLIEPGDWDTVIFDESHNLKNAFVSKKGTAGINIAAMAKNVMFASATALDKPEHIAYLRQVIGEEHYNELYNSLGIRRQISINKETGKVTVRYTYSDKVTDEDQARILDGLAAELSRKGQMISRQLPLSNVAIKFTETPLSDRQYQHADDLYDQIYRIESAKNPMNAVGIAGMAVRAYLESVKVDSAFEHTMEALREGKQVVIFAERIDEGNEGTYQEGINGTLTQLLVKLEKELGRGMVGQVYGGDSVRAAADIGRFQHGDIQVLIGTPNSAGTGISLDDIFGDSPRHLEIMTAPMSAMTLVQVLGRVNRLTTMSKATASILFTDHPIDTWNLDIAAKKMITLSAQVSGDLTKIQPLKKRAAELQLNDDALVLSEISDTGVPGTSISEGEARDMLTSPNEEIRDSAKAKVVASNKQDAEEWRALMNKNVMSDEEIIRLAEDPSAFKKLSPGHKHLQEKGIQFYEDSRTITPEAGTLLRAVFAQAEGDRIEQWIFEQEKKMKALGLGGKQGGIPFMRLKEGKHAKHVPYVAEEMGNTFLHEFAHGCYYCFTPVPWRKKIARVYAKIGGRVGSGKWFASANPMQASRNNQRYYSKNVYEFFAQSMAEYVFEHRVPGKILANMYEKQLSTLEHYYELMRRRIDLTELRPVFDNLMNLRQSAKHIDFAYPDRSSLTAGFQPKHMSRGQLERYYRRKADIYDSLATGSDPTEFAHYPHKPVPELPAPAIYEDWTNGMRIGDIARKYETPEAEIEAIVNGELRADGLHEEARGEIDINQIMLGMKPTFRGIAKRLTPGLQILEDARAGLASLMPTLKSKAHLEPATDVRGELGILHHQQEVSRYNLRPDWRAAERLGVNKDLGVSMKFMVTQQDEADLRAKGYSQASINKLTPQDVDDILHPLREKLMANPGMQFMSNMSQGRKQATPELDATAAKIKGMFDARLKALEKAGYPVEALEHYFPGQWSRESRRAFNMAMDEASNAGQIPADFDIANPPSGFDDMIAKRVAELMREGKGSDKDFFEYYARRPVHGRQSFRKPKVFEDTMTGVRYGLEPRSTNYVEMTMAKLAELDKAVMGHRLMNKWKAEGKLRQINPSQKVPEGWRVLPDPYGTVYAPGLRIVGKRIVPAEYADVIENYMSSSLYNNRYVGKPFTLWMAVANILNQTQLGVGSAFHAGFTTTEAQVTAHANLLKDIYGIMRGNRSSSQVKETFKKVGTAFYQTAKTGDAVLNAYLHPDGTMDPRIAQVVRAVELAGGGTQLEKGLKTEQIDKQYSDWFSGHKIRAAMRSPVAFIELLAKPIMEFLVPRQKLGVFAEKAWRIIEQNPGVPTEELAKEFNAAWNFVDGALGQVRYDRLFINNVAKNVVQGSIRAPGWTGGTLVNLGGAIKDAYRFFKEWQETGSLPKDIPDRTAYAISLLTTVAVMNAVLTWLFTRSHPKGSDFIAFRTGREDESGNPERYVLPTYMKDVYSYSKHPGETLLHKTHPLIGVVGDILKNKDFYGVQVRDPDANTVAQAYQSGKHLVKAFEPFWIRGTRRAADRGAGFIEKVLPLAGVMPAPRSLTQTPSQAEVEKYWRGQRSAEGVAPEKFERQRAKGKLVSEIRHGGKADVAAALRKGIINPRDVSYLYKRAQLGPLAAGIDRMPLEDAEKVYAKANPEERAQLAGIIARKRASSARRSGRTAFAGF